MSGLRPKKGQSLIEAIVAIGVITMAIVAILAMGLIHTILGGESSERMVATNLAREGIEIMIAIQNSNRLDPTATWPYGLANGNWIVNYNDTSLSAANSSSITDCTNCWLCRQASDLRTHCASAEVFKRMVSISDGDDLGGNCSGCEKKVVSTVYWAERGRIHTVSLEAHLTDWR